MKYIERMKKSIKRIVFVPIVATTLICSAFSIIAESEIKGWFLAGSAPESYEIGLTSSQNRSGNIAYLRSTEEVSGRGFGTIMQQFTPKKYLGKKVKLTGYIKSKDVKGWAGMWMRVDGASKRSLSFDNMQDRPIKGTTDWKKYEIILDVPKESKLIAYGVLLSGTGNVSIDNFNFEVIEDGVKTTGPGNYIQLEEPTNTSFEENN